MVAKGVAAPSLLDSYNDERPPIIAEMLKLSSTLFNNFVQAKSGGKDRENAWKRGGDLHQFGVNYRWSPIVLDERTQKEDKPVDPYGHTRSPAGIVRAGERAPDASGLVILAAKGGFNPAHPTTSLFKLFDASHHTVLLFSDGSNKVSQVVAALQAYPTDLLKTVLVRTETSHLCRLLMGSTGPFWTVTGMCTQDTMLRNTNFWSSSFGRTVALGVFFVARMERSGTLMECSAL